MGSELELKDLHRPLPDNPLIKRPYLTPLALGAGTAAVLLLNLNFLMVLAVLFTLAFLVNLKPANQASQIKEINELVEATPLEAKLDEAAELYALEHYGFTPEELRTQFKERVELYYNSSGSRKRQVKGWLQESSKRLSTLAEKFPEQIKYLPAPPEYPDNWKLRMGHKYRARRPYGESYNRKLGLKSYKCSYCASPLSTYGSSLCRICAKTQLDRRYIDNYQKLQKQREKLDQAISGLSAQSQIVKALHRKGYTTLDIAKKLGITSAKVKAYIYD